MSAYEYSDGNTLFAGYLAIDQNQKKMLNLVDYTAALPFNVAYISLYQLYGLL